MAALGSQEHKKKKIYEQMQIVFVDTAKNI